MTLSRRSVLAASLEVAGAAGVSTLARAAPRTVPPVADLVRISEQSNAALLRGDVKTFLDLAPHAHDYTLMSPFGGKPTHGTALTSARWEEIGRFFANGRLSVEVVQAYGSADLVALALIERANVEVGGLPAQDWALRVTLVYRRAGSGWELVHRHADPLVEAITLDEAAALGTRPRSP
jgi:ketosteroid isomerase-like protein